MSENNNSDVNEEIVEKANDSDVNSEQEDERNVDLKTDDVEIKEPERVKTPLETAQEQAEEYKNSLMRLQADFENYKKRNKDLSSKMYAEGIIDVITVIFPVLDSLDHALTMYKDKKDREGIELIIKQFMTVFQTLGIEEIKALGEEFNPELHEAVAQCDKDDTKSNIVVEVFRKGYKFKDRVIRPSMVKVGK